MTKVKLIATALVSMLATAPSLAEAHHYRHHHHYHHAYSPLSYPISYIHNYGPGVTPGTFAYYDGPATNHCYQSSTAYIGQDGRRYPCF